MALNFALVICVAILEPLLSNGENATTNAPPITPALPGFANIDLAALSKSSAVLSANAAPKGPDGSADFGAAATTQATTTQGPDCGSNNCTMDKSHMFEHRNNTGHPVGGQKADVRKASQAQVAHVDKAKAGNSTVAVKGKKVAVVSSSKPVVVVQ